MAELRHGGAPGRLAVGPWAAIYRMLSENGNPRLSSLMAILHALGLDLSVKPEVGWRNGSRERRVL